MILEINALVSKKVLMVLNIELIIKKQFLI